MMEKGGNAVQNPRQMDRWEWTNMNEFLQGPPESQDGPEGSS